jgi:hypothetical protein
MLLPDGLKAIVKAVIRENIIDRNEAWLFAEHNQRSIVS